MKIIENFLQFLKGSADSYGYLVIKLEKKDNREKIIKKYNRKAIKFGDINCIFDKDESTKDILVFRQHQCYSNKVHK